MRVVQYELCMVSQATSDRFGPKLACRFHGPTVESSFRSLDTKHIDTTENKENRVNTRHTQTRHTEIGHIRASLTIQKQQYTSP